MINLLPEDRKREIRAARANVLLLRYNFLAVGVVAALALLCAGTYVILQNNKQNALATISANEQKTSTLADVRKAADEYRQNLTLAGKIIDNGVSYTDIVIGITKLMPAGAVLDGLALGGAGTAPAQANATAAAQQIVFQAQAKDYAAAEKLKQNFQSSPLFSNVYFQGLSDDTATNKSKYPVKVTMSAKLNIGTKANSNAK